MTDKQEQTLKNAELREDRFRPTVAGWQSSAIVAIAFAGLFLVLAAYLPADVFDSTSHIFILSIGVIGLWRYGWWFVHYFRGVIYRRFVFPRLRKQADRMTDAGFRPGHVYVLCTSYRMEPSVTYAVYEGILRNASDYGVPTTVFAAVSDRTDVDVLALVVKAPRSSSRKKKGMERLKVEAGRRISPSINTTMSSGPGSQRAMARSTSAIALRFPSPRWNM